MFAPTSIRLQATGPTVTELLQAGGVATFRRKSARPVESSNWTWIQGRLSTAPQDVRGTFITGSNGTNYGTQDVWISTSQFMNGTPQFHNNSTNNGRCEIAVRDTALRHAPGNNWVSNYRLQNTGATFTLTGDAPVISGGFRWRLGVITGTAAETRDGQGRSWNGRMMWVAHTQLINRAGTLPANCN